MIYIYYLIKYLNEFIFIIFTPILLKLTYESSTANFEILFISYLQKFLSLKLNLLYISLFILYLFLSNNFLFLVKNIIILNFIYYLLNIDFLIIDYYIVLSKQVMNEKLTNGLFLIHPSLLYFYYSMVIYTFLILNIFILNNYLFLNIYINLIGKLVYNFSILFIICFLALYLGSWWAQQEIAWNGWWGWDFIEIINLIFFFIIIYIRHQSYFLKSYFWFNNVFSLIIIINVLYFFYIRFGFLKSIHSFLSIISLNQYFFLIIICCLIFYLVFLKVSLNKYSIYKKKLLFKIMNFYNLQFNFINFSFFLSILFINISIITKFNTFNFFSLKFILIFSLFFFLFMNSIYSSNLIIPFFDSIIIKAIWKFILLLKKKMISIIHFFFLMFIFIWLFYDLTFDFLIWQRNYNIIEILFYFKLNILFFLTNYKYIYSYYCTNLLLFFNIDKNFFESNSILYNNNYLLLDKIIFLHYIFEFYNFIILYSYLYILYILFLILIYIFFTYIKKKKYYKLKNL